MRKGILIIALVTVCGAARAFDAAPLLPWVTAPTADPYLVAWYKLDGDATDSGLGGYDGTVTGGTWTNGVYGQALRFAGSTPVANTVNTYGMGIRQYATFSLWVNPHTASENRYIGDWDYGTPPTGMHIRSNADGSVMFFIYPDNTRITTSAGLVPLGAWTHIVGIIDSTVIRVYVDSTLIASRNIVSDLGNSTKPIMIGGRGDASGCYAAIDDIRIYTRALSSNDVGRIYQGLTPKHD